MARVMVLSGAKVVAEVPLIRPLSRTYSTASAYQASAATSEKPVSSTAAKAVRFMLSTKARAIRTAPIRLILRTVLSS